MPKLLGLGVQPFCQRNRSKKPSAMGKKGIVVLWHNGCRSLIASAVYFVGLSRILLLLVLLFAVHANYVLAQESGLSPELSLDVTRPFTSHRERVLSPIPKQFDWVDREVRPNPLLETLLGLREDGPPRFMLSATLAEQYSDNYFQTESETREEYRTSANIGTVYRLEGPQSFISLANAFNANYEARSEKSDIGFVNFTASAGYQLPRLSFALSDSFVRDEDTEVASSSGIRGGTSSSDMRSGKRTFLRNRFSPQLRYALTRLTSVAFRYVNTFVESEGGDPGDDSMGHELATDIQHRFSRLWSGGLHYAFAYDSRDGAADTQSHNASIGMGYMLDRRTHVALSAFASVVDRSGGGEDSQTYGASINLRRQLTAFLEAFVAVGATAFDRDGLDPEFHANWQVGAEGTLPFSPQTSLSLTGRQEVRDTAGDVDSVGVVLSRSISLSLNHRVTRFLFASLFASFNRTEFLEDSIGTTESELVEDREDTFWRAGTRLSYALTRMLSLSLEYFYRQRESNVPDGQRDYDENQLTFTISGNFSLL